MSLQLATVTQLKQAFDVNQLRQLASDIETPLTESQLDTSDVVEKALKGASAEVLVLARQGRRYSKDDLENLVALTTVIPNEDGVKTGEDAGGQLLIEIVCKLAYARLLQRRGYDNEGIQAKVPGYSDAMHWLDLLRTGEAVFDLDDNTRAGMSGHTQVKSVTRNRPSDQARRYFAADDTGPVI